MSRVWAGLNEQELERLKNMSKAEVTRPAQPKPESGIRWWHRLFGLKPMPVTVAEPEEKVEKREAWNTQKYEYLVVPKTSSKSYFDILGNGESKWFITHYAPLSDQSDRVDVKMSVHGRLVTFERTQSQFSPNKLDIKIINHHPPTPPDAEIFSFGDIQMMIKGQEVIFSGEDITTQYYV